MARQELIDNLKIIASGWEILHLTPMARDKLLGAVDYIERLETENVALCSKCEKLADENLRLEQEIAEVRGYNRAEPKPEE